MENVKISSEEFRNKLEEFFVWTSPNKETYASWWLSLEDFAKKKFDETFD